MQTRNFLFLVVLITPQIARADEAAEAKAKKDMEGLQGTWKMVKYLDKDGQEFPPDKVFQPKHTTWKFTGNKLDCGFFQPGSEVTLDCSTNPPRIFIKSYHKPTRTENSVKGVYDLAGKKLPLCLAVGKGDYPTKLESSKDGKTIVMEFIQEEK